MTTDYRALLKHFDPVGIDRYGITPKDLEAVDKYIRILQANLPTTVWEEAVDIGGEYGTSIIIHFAAYSGWASTLCATGAEL